MRWYLVVRGRNSGNMVQLWAREGLSSPGTGIYNKDHIELWQDWDWSPARIIATRKNEQYITLPNWYIIQI